MPQPRIARCDHPSKSAASFVGVHGGVPMGMLRLTRVRMQGIYTMSEVAMATLRAKIRGQQYGITPPPDHFGMPNVYRSRTTDRTEAVFASPRADALRLAARCSMLTGVGSPQDGASRLPEGFQAPEQVSKGMKRAAETAGTTVRGGSGPIVSPSDAKRVRRPRTLPRTCSVWRTWPTNSQAWWSHLPGAE